MQNPVFRSIRSIDRHNNNTIDSHNSHTTTAAAAAAAVMEEACACAVAGALVAFAAIAAEAADPHLRETPGGRRLVCKTLKRNRKKIQDIFDELEIPEKVMVFFLDTIRVLAKLAV